MRLDGAPIRGPPRERAPRALPSCQHFRAGRLRRGRQGRRRHCPRGRRRRPGDPGVQGPPRGGVAHQHWAPRGRGSGTVGSVGGAHVVGVGVVHAGPEPQGARPDRVDVNEDAVRLADSDAPPQVKGLANFMALNTRLEQRLWDWIKDKKPHYAFNAILSDTVMGECLDPVHQGVPSTAGMVHWVWKGENHHILDMVQPRWHVDTRDVGLLYVAALTTPGLDGERLFGFGERFSWFKVREILSGLYPEQEIPQVKDWGMDQTEVPNQRGAELLRGMGRNGWTSLEDSVQANAQSFLILEKRNK